MAGVGAGAAARFASAFALHRAGRLEEAQQGYREALLLAPQLAEAHHMLGIISCQRGDLGCGAKWFRHALQVRPRFVAAWMDLGAALQELADAQGALVCFERVLALEPDHVDAQNSRAEALALLGLHEDALQCFDALAATRPDDARAHNNAGSALLALGRFQDALARFERAIAIEPRYAKAMANRGMMRLLLGDFAKGWLDWELRGHLAATPAPRRFSAPRWSGADDLRGKRVLLTSEQGLGDVIQFCRYAPMLSRRGVDVSLEVPAALVALMRTLDGSVQVVAEGDPLPKFDAHFPLLSLPLAFATELSSIPPGTASGSAYLHADQLLLQQWQLRLGPRTGWPRIGLAWSGSARHKNDRQRSMALQTMLEALDGIDAQLFSLQKEVRDGDLAALSAHPRLLHFGADLRSFADTAALASQMDAVVSVDTSIAHLAAALGRRTCVLLPFVPDWRWMLERSDSPWYPAARLCRQNALGEWSGALVTARRYLNEWGAAAGASRPIPVAE